MKPDRGQCRHCGRGIIFVPTRKGKRMPIDEKPDARGTVIVPRSGPVLVFKNADEAYRAHPTLHRFTSHHVTCPQKRLAGVA